MEVEWRERKGFRNKKVEIVGGWKERVVEVEIIWQMLRKKH